MISGIDLYNESKSILPTRNWKLGNIGEAWFVGDTINIGLGLGALLLDDALEVVVDLRAHLHRLGEVLGADGQDHELLARVGGWGWG